MKTLYLILCENFHLSYIFILLLWIFLQVDKAHLKDEIAAEVKKALKPFYTIGLIDKEDYKDIMRKCVPKVSIFFWKNLHNCLCDNIFGVNLLPNKKYGVLRIKI